MKNWFLNLFSNNNVLHLNWMEVRHQPVSCVDKRHVFIGQHLLRHQLIDLSIPFQAIDIDTLRTGLQEYENLENLTPQLAALIYDITRLPEAMALYFPILKTLDDEKRQQFAYRVQDLLNNPNFKIVVWTTNQLEANAPSSTAYVIAGHIVEIFFYRPDLITYLFSKPRHFNIYVNSTAYKESGGIGGGCYDPKTESIKLVASRLYEGFYDKSPGVAPFIHEFGHMLDDFNVNRASGLLPGMRETDGEFFSDEAKTLFMQGKKIELHRYEQARLQRPSLDGEIPIGHPYVFQNDGEFIAGYLEMFFRNPNYFRRQNPTLFDGFVKLFRQDPCTYWEVDFDYYIQQNRSVYLHHHQHIYPAGLKIFS